MILDHLTLHLYRMTYFICKDISFVPFKQRFLAAVLPRLRINLILIDTSIFTAAFIANIYYAVLQIAIYLVIRLNLFRGSRVLSSFMYVGRR